jgi:streptogramin lyase
VNGGGINQFSGAFHITVDTAGKIYVSDFGNGRIVRIDDMTGAGWTTLSGFTNPEGIALDMVDRIYVANNLTDQIVRLDDITGTGAVAYP